MRKYGLLSVVRRRKYCHYSQGLHRYKNLLNRDFHADRPNQKWVTDISYIPTSQGFLYLSVIRDLFDCSVVAYKTSTVQNVNLVLNTIRAAKKKERVTAELQLHSDQGFQHTSLAYFNLTKEYHITPSMSRRGNTLYVSGEIKAGRAIQLDFQWLQTQKFITTGTDCTGIEAGEYYLAWIGRSNNTQPIIQSVKVLEEEV